MAISVPQVEYLAHLARLKLTPEELTQFAPQIDEILGYVEKLKKAQTQGVPPTTHPLPLTNVFREDRSEKSLEAHQALSNAPERQGPFFKVPRIIEAG